jgi:hypothetical protein
MARRVGFHVYSVKVKKRYRRESEVLSNLPGPHDLLTVFLQGMRGTLNAQNNDEEVERVACLKRLERSDRHLIGILEAGHYGEANDIVHAPTGRLTHAQNVDEAALLPSFFRLVIPEGMQTGLLILQRDNRVQSKGALLSVLKPILASVSDEFVLHVNPVMNRQTFERWVGEGQVQQLRFVRYSITEDFADEYDRGRDETEGTMELVVKARRGRTLPLKDKIISWFRSDAPVRDIFEIPGLEEFAYDDVKVDLKIGNRTKRVDFGRKLTNPIIDLTDSIKWRSGRPTWESLVRATAELAEDEMLDVGGDGT